MSITEDRWSPASGWCPHPEHWHSDDDQAAEHEVTVLVAAFVTALQPEIVVETGTNTGQTAAAIGAALKASGHGHLYSLEIVPALAELARDRCAGLPVTVVNADSRAWDPPGLIGVAWLDSDVWARRAELERWVPYFADGAVIGIHDTGPQHPVAASLQPLIDAGTFRALTLRTPRGVTFGQLTEGTP